MDYEFAPITTDNDSLREIANLLFAAFPKSNKFSEKFLAWQYRDNPNGTIRGFNAFYNGELVAHYAIMPIVASIFNKTEKGLLSLNTATHPDHQGKKLFTTLAEMSYNAAAEEGYGFVVGVANANSTHGFITKLGFQLVGMLDAKLGVGKLHYKEQKETVDFEKKWSDASIRWRLSNPETVYKIKNNKIVAATDTTGIEAVLMNTELSDNKKSVGSRPIKLWIGLDTNIDWKKSFYFDVPMKMRPSPLNFIFKDLTGADRKLEQNKIKFNALDFDAY